LLRFALPLGCVFTRVLRHGSLFHFREQHVFSFGIVAATDVLPKQRSY
jgi:hypothetical protein